MWLCAGCYEEYELGALVCYDRDFFCVSCASKYVREPEKLLKADQLVSRVTAAAERQQERESRRD